MNFPRVPRSSPSHRPGRRTGLSANGASIASTNQAWFVALGNSSTASLAAGRQQ
jgi:hypothetical protein